MTITTTTTTTAALLGCGPTFAICFHSGHLVFRIPFNFDEWMAPFDRHSSHFINIVAIMNNAMDRREIQYMRHLALFSGLIRHSAIIKWEKCMRMQATKYTQRMYFDKITITGSKLEMKLFSETG